MDYSNKIFRKFYSTGNYVEFIESNDVDATLVEIAERFCLNLKRSGFKNLQFTQLGFGASRVHNGYDEKGMRKYLFVPSAQLDIIRGRTSNHSAVRVYEPTVNYEEWRHTIVPSKEKTYYKLPYYEKKSTECIVDPNCTYVYIKEAGSFPLDRSVELLKKPEAKEVVANVLGFLQGTGIYDYINKYYGRLIDGVLYYQSGPEVEKGIHRLIKK